jgi:RNA-directed DNA polymerase
VIKAQKAITHISWQVVDYNVIALSIKKLQNRIVKAKIDGRIRMVKKLQLLLVKSLNARILAVKRVSENKGKNTAGIDGELLNTDGKKMRYVRALKVDLSTYRAQPLKRVEIPKKNGKMRPLGIPTMFDRTLQALYKMALEPIAEVTADKNSYGFRVKRSTQDAMKQIWLRTCQKSARHWVLEADIKGCFDNISHQWLYDNIPLDNRLLKQWLKSGFIKNDTLFPTNSGTPQGGIISPILANMVLDGIEAIVRKYNKIITKTINKVVVHRQGVCFNFIRYADDFVIIGENPKLLRLLQAEIEVFLNERGLELSKEKTRITNIYEGFDFLGFHFRKFPNGKMLVQPTKEGIKSFKLKVKEIFKLHRSSNISVLIKKLNPLIRGWGNYYRFVNSKSIFDTLDSYIWFKSMNWVKRLHQRKHIAKYVKRYFKVYPEYSAETLSDGKNFVFRLSSISLREHVKVRNEANPFDRNYDEYFLKRYISLRNLTAS